MRHGCALGASRYASVRARLQCQARFARSDAWCSPPHSVEMDFVRHTVPCRQAPSRHASSTPTAHVCPPRATVHMRISSPQFSAHSAHAEARTRSIVQLRRAAHDGIYSSSSSSALSSFSKLRIADLICCASFGLRSSARVRCTIAFDWSPSFLYTLPRTK